MAGWLLGAGSGGLRAPDASLEGSLPEVGSAGPTAPLQRAGETCGETCAEPTPEIAMRRLFDAHYDAIWRLLRRLGVQASQLDDAAQEVFWVAARKLSEIGAGSENAFLYGVALRIASQEHRRRKGAPRTVEVEALAVLRDLRPSPEEQLEQRRARALLDVVLEQMAPELRTVFVLCELEELEVREAAALEAIPLGTASSRLRRARDEFSSIAKRVRATLGRGGLR
jgi:RNA polymerase sigma-70 factor (ECF subfamily)